MKRSKTARKRGSFFLPVLSLFKLDIHVEIKF